MNRRKHIEREERLVLRGKREQAAGKLLQRVPELTSLSLAIRETRPNGATGETQYIRRVVLEHAHALFEMPCSHPSCENGGYDVTREVLAALSSRTTSFTGESICPGSAGAEGCARVLRYVGTATYRAQTDAQP